MIKKYPTSIFSSFNCLAYKPSIIILIMMVFHVSAKAQTLLNSLKELLPYLEKSSVNVKMKPGTYWITEEDITNNVFSKETVAAGRLSRSLLLFEGNNNFFDFTGVTIKIETGVFKAVGKKHQLYEVHTVGNHNIIKNLTLEDVGKVTDHPAKGGANSIVMDGIGNRIEGFHISIKGSFPYGYGDIFGKGGKSLIPHQKHCACLVRGDSNHVKGCTFIQKSYGHCIYFQAANDPFIEDCYLEGEIRTTDDVLAEKGTGSPADKLNFKTLEGHTLQPGWTFSLQEAGIRSYNGGETIINGKEYKRGCTSPKVVGCTIVKMRVGVNIGWAKGYKLIEDCTALACEVGYWIGDNGNVINCKGDSSIGPLYSEDLYRSGSNIDLTLVDNYIPRHGNHPSLYLGGSNHNIVIKDETTSFDEDLEIFVSGTRKAHRWKKRGGLRKKANELKIVNKTKYPIVLGNNATKNNITSCGSIKGKKSKNTIYENCDE